MQIKCLLTLLFLISPVLCFAQRTGGPISTPSPINVTDGTTSCYPYSIAFTSAGSVTCSNGIASVTNSGGGGGGGSGTVTTGSIFQIPYYSATGTTLVGATNFYNNNTNIGIGTTTGSERLEVNGTVKSTGIQLTTGASAGYVLTSNSVGVGTWYPASSGGASAAGGLGAVQYNSPIGTLAGKENIFSFNGTNVGIGTTNGNMKLDVRGNVGIGTANVGNGAWLGIIGDGIDGSDTKNLFTVNGSSNFASRNALFSINKDGNVGIGTVDSYSSKFALTNGSEDISAGNLNAYGSLISNQGNLLLNKNNSYAVTGYGVGSGYYLGGDGNDDVQLTTTFFNSYDLIFKTNNTQRMVLDTANLGIGTAHPGTILDVAGTTRTTGFQLTTGASSSYVLTSNSVGIGTWQPATGGGGGGTTIQTYITGMIVTKNTGAQTIDVSAGSFYDPSSSSIITYAGATNIAVGTLNTASNQWNQVYGYNNSGTTTLEIVMNANPPSSTYLGTARQGGTGGNRRWLGCFLSNANGAGAAIIPQDVKENAANGLQVLWLTSNQVSPFRVVAAGTNTSYGSETSAIGCVPRYVPTEILMLQTPNLATIAGDGLNVRISEDGVNAATYIEPYLALTSSFPTSTLWCPIEPSTPGFYYLIASTGGPGTGGRIYLDIISYKMAR